MFLSILTLKYRFFLPCNSDIYIIIRSRIFIIGLGHKWGERESCPDTLGKWNNRSTGKPVPIQKKTITYNS